MLSGRVEVFRPDGTYLFSFNQIGIDKNGQPLTIKSPLYIAINKAGNVYVSDKSYDSILIFNAQGQFISKFVPNLDPAFRWAPVGMTFDNEDNLYVTDVLSQHRVLVFDRQGKLKLQFGATAMTDKKGESPGKFYFPNDIFVDRDKKIFVADSNNRRIQVFSPEGKYLYMISMGGLPRGIAIDEADRLYVVDGLGHNITVYKKTDKNAKSITAFGGQGTQFGQFLYPNGLVLEKGGHRIFVTDRENNRIQVWTWPTVAAAVSPNVKKAMPVGLFLGALALLLAWRLLRRRRYFASMKFISEIVADRQLYALKRVAKKVYVHPATYEKYKKYSEGDVAGEDVLRPLTADELQVESYKVNENLGDEAALLFAGAGKGLVKPRMLSNDARSHIVAQKLNLESMDYRLFLDYYQPEG
jgi:sugar lactone lactonase YvrE